MNKNYLTVCKHCKFFQQTDKTYAPYCLRGYNLPTTRIDCGGHSRDVDERTLWVDKYGEVYEGLKEI